MPNVKSVDYDLKVYKCYVTMNGNATMTMAQLEEAFKTSKYMPKGIVERWNTEVAKILRTDEMKIRTKSEGLDPAGGPPQELGELIRRDVEKWRRVMREAKIRREG